MGNFDFKYTVQSIGNVFQSQVQEKWRHYFVTESNLLYIHTLMLLDYVTSTCLCQGIAGP